VSERVGKKVVELLGGKLKGFGGKIDCLMIVEALSYLSEKSSGEAEIFGRLLPELLPWSMIVLVAWNEDCLVESRGV
jgi:hypothetical protein